MNYNLTRAEIYELKEQVSLNLWRWELGDKTKDEEFKKDAYENIKTLLAGPQQKASYLTPKMTKRIFQIKLWQEFPKRYERDKSLGLVNYEQLSQ